MATPPLTNRQAWRLYEHLLSDDRIVLQADEPTRLETRWKSLSASDIASPKTWMDTYLAGFALAGGYTLVTTDAAFTEFAGLDLTLVGEHATPVTSTSGGEASDLTSSRPLEFVERLG